MKKKILFVFGTRPEAIKMCPIIEELKKDMRFEWKVCVTGQHKEMLSQVLETFDVEPDYDLMIMKENQNLNSITRLILERIESILLKESPDIVLVHGDTTTTLSAALACFYQNIPVGHIEAGLRTYNLHSPFPEEFNRQTVGIIAKYHFAPTQRAKANLLREGKENVFVTGNTAIDALKYTVSDTYYAENLEWAKNSKLILVTAHRRENWNCMKEMFEAIKLVIDEFEDVKVIFPMHMNPNIRIVANNILGKLSRVRLIEPLNVVDFHNYMKKSYLIITDSGGIQEEAPAMGIPVLVMRDTTERPEGVEAGTLKLVGTKKIDIYCNVKKLLTDNEVYKEMSEAKNPYGDGNASKRIVELLEKIL